MSELTLVARWSAHEQVGDILQLGDDTIASLQTALAAANAEKDALAVGWQALHEAEEGRQADRQRLMAANTSLFRENRDLYEQLQQANARAEAAEAAWARCGKENCMGLEVDSVARWVREEALQAQRERAEAAERERDTMRRSSEHNYEACVRALADRDEAVGLLRRMRESMVWECACGEIVRTVMQGECWHCHRQAGMAQMQGEHPEVVWHDLETFLARLPTATEENN